MTTKTKFENFVIHGLTPSGVRVVVSGFDYAVKGVTLYPGDTLEITEAIRDLNADRNGDSFLDLTPEQQRERWGAVRWGLGAEVPQHVFDALEESRLKKLRAERADIIYSGRLRNDGEKLARLKAINSELGNS